MLCDPSPPSPSQPASTLTWSRCCVTRGVGRNNNNTDQRSLQTKCNLVLVESTFRLQIRSEIEHFRSRSEGRARATSFIHLGHTKIDIRTNWFKISQNSSSHARGQLEDYITHNNLSPLRAGSKILNRIDGTTSGRGCSQLRKKYFRQCLCVVVGKWGAKPTQMIPKEKIIVVFGSIYLRVSKLWHRAMAQRAARPKFISPQIDTNFEHNTKDVYLNCVKTKPDQRKYTWHTCDS